MDYTLDPKDFKWAVRIVLLIALLVVCSKAAPLIWPERQVAPPQPMYYAPDPTPFVVETQRIEILSNNQFFSNNQTCIGVCK